MAKPRPPLRASAIVAVAGRLRGVVLGSSAEKVPLRLLHEIVVDLQPIGDWTEPRLALYTLALPVRSWRGLIDTRHRFPRSPRQTIRDGVPVTIGPSAGGELILGALLSPLRVRELAFGRRTGTRLAVRIAATITPLPALDTPPFDVSLRTRLQIEPLLLRGDVSSYQVAGVEAALRAAAAVVDLADYGAATQERWVQLAPAFGRRTRRR